VNGPCICTYEHGRDETDLLRQLIADGMGQWEASRRLWGPEADALADAAAVRTWIRTEFLRHFPWLKLPPHPQELPQEPEARTDLCSVSLSPSSR